MRSILALCASALLIATAVAVVRGSGVREVEARAGQEEAPVAGPADPRAVVSVRVEGELLPVAALERVLATRVGNTLREDDLTRDRAAIVATLQARGHLAAEVQDVRIVWSGGAHVVFHVAAGGVYQVARVRVEGKPTRRFADLARVPTLLAGQPWHPDRAAANVTLLRDWLAQRGVKADVTARRVVDHVQHTVDVTFVVR